MATNRLSVARATATIGIAPLVLAATQALLLYLTTSSSLVLNALYGCTSLCGTFAQGFVPLIAALYGIAMFALPGIIGACSRTWRSALVLAVLPWWVVVIAHAGTLLTPYVGLAVDVRGGRFDLPFWLDAGHLTVLLASLALFAALGSLGWLARRAFSGA